MKRIIRALALVALLGLVCATAAAEPQKSVALTNAASSKVYTTASTTSKVVATLGKDEPVEVISSTSTWSNVRMADGQIGWIAKSGITALAKPAPRSRFASNEAYAKYLKVALRKGERVKATEDYGLVSKGMMGSFYGYAVEGEPPVLVIWDQVTGATPWDVALGTGFPKVLSDQVYFVEPQMIEIMGEKDAADIYRLADKAARSVFYPGSYVVLGKHSLANPSDAESANWSTEMDSYVGMRAMIQSIDYEDSWGFAVATVDVDGGSWYWRIADMAESYDYGYDDGYGYYDDYGYDDGYGYDDYGYDDGYGYDDYGYDDGYGYDYYDPYESYAPGEESYGKIKVGSKVILGRHDTVNGSANWSSGMDRYVGQEAEVTELTGQDSYGMLTVRVKGNSYVWRVRNLRLVGSGVEGSYGFKVGDKVILGRHREVNGISYWADGMFQYIGLSAKITGIVGIENTDAKCYLFTVDVDGGDWHWRAENMTPDTGK